MAASLTVTLAESESLIPSGRTVTYTLTISNSSANAVQVTSIAAFNSDGGVIGGLPSTYPLVPGNGSSLVTFTADYFNKNAPSQGPRTATANVTVYGADGSVTTCSYSPQVVIYNPDTTPGFAANTTSRWWQDGQANFAVLQDSGLFPVLGF